MKIVSQTQNEMVLEDRSYYFQVVYSIVFFALSLIFFYSMIRQAAYAGLWVPGLLLLIALLCFGSKEKIITRIDRKGKKISLDVIKKFLKRKAEYPLDDVASVKVQRIWKLFLGDTGGVGFYFVLKNGDEVRFNLAIHSIVFMGDLPYLHPLPKNFLQFGENIAHFIGVPYEKVGRFGPLFTKGY